MFIQTSSYTCQIDFARIKSFAKNLKLIFWYNLYVQQKTRVKDQSI